MLPGELELLLQSRTLELQQATSNFRPGSSPFDERRSRSYNDPSYFTDSGLRPPLGCVPYKIDTNLAVCETAPSQGHAAFGDDSAARNYGPDASGLDHLAHAAMRSPPVVTSNEKQTTPDVDPSLSGAASVSFPTFPHDIFNSGAETYVTPTLPPSPEIRMNTSLSSSIPQSVSVGTNIDGLPSKELLEIMFVFLWVG
jgi:hypothetical protein